MKTLFLILFWMLSPILAHSQMMTILLLKGEIQASAPDSKEWTSLHLFDSIPVGSKIKFTKQGFIAGINSDGNSFELSGTDDTISTDQLFLGMQPRPLLLPLIKEFIAVNKEALLANPPIKYYQYKHAIEFSLVYDFLFNPYGRDTIVGNTVLVRYNKKYNPLRITLTNYFDEEFLWLEVEYDSVAILKSDKFQERSFKVNVIPINIPENSLTMYVVVLGEIEKKAHYSELNKLFLRKVSTFNYVDKLLLAYYYEKRKFGIESMKIYEDLVSKFTLEDFYVYYGAYTKRVMKVELKK